MSGDEHSKTVPPPAGADDAYNAATKVGSMPREVIDRLRAEGLLPEGSFAPPPPRVPQQQPPRPPPRVAPRAMPAAPIPAPAPEAVPEAETVGVLPSFAADSPVPPAASAIAVPGAIPIAIPGAAPVPDRDLVGAAPPPAAFALPASSHSSIAAPNALRRSRVPLIAGAIVVLALLVTLVLTLR